MEKFTKFEGKTITAALNNAMSIDIASIQEAEEAGKNPIFTSDFIKQMYVDLIERVEKMTRKNN
jgi:hypothetical protein